mgnify:CR=1 FL=1
MPTNTTNYALKKPTISGDSGQWGTYLNEDLDSLDSLLGGGTAITGIDINSGSIDGAAIGSASASTGAFTSVAVDNITIDGQQITSTDTNGNIQLFANGTGYVEIYGNTNAGAIRFNCESNSHGVTIKGPPHSAAATYSLELPDADGTTGQFLKTDGSGKLSFGTVSATTLGDLGITASAAEVNYNDITTLGTSEASKTVTADANGDVSLAAELTAVSYNDTFVTLSSSSNAVSLDCEAGNSFTHTLSENTTFTFANPPSGKSFTFILKVVQDGSASGFTLTWPTVKWNAATAPTLTATASAIDYFVFTYDGTNWYGFTAAQAMG